MACEIPASRARQCTQPCSRNQRSNQYGLAERAQGARALRGADPVPVGGPQPGEELHDVAWEVERGSIDDQREASDSSGHDLGRPVLPGVSHLPGLVGHPEIISLGKPQWVRAALGSALPHQRYVLRRADRAALSTRRSGEAEQGALQ
ncbi:hypothetical protein GCM10010320_79600 [Streptomyces caelestis]|nr:hypothetical protein GCM10010320_79600 [Streptomyces caelestis]